MNDCENSEKMLFVACEILAKKLVNREILASVDDFDSNTDNSGLEVKKLILFRIASKLYQIIGLNASVNRIPEYTVRSCINAISLCMLTTVLNSTNFESSFLNYMKLLAPDFAINELFIKPHDVIVFIEPSKVPLGVHHQYVIRILSSLLDYIVNSTYFENYYYFRRNLYAFRNHYLVYYLNYSIFTLKSAFFAADKNT